MAHRILIIGIGSPVGDDRAGLVAAERLRHEASLGPQVAIESAERAGLRLIDLWSRDDRVILLDAVHTGAPPGSVLRLRAEQIEATRRPWSSHGIGPAEAIALARELDRLPASLVLYGVEIAVPPNGLALSPGVEEALVPLLERVRAEVRILSHAGAPAD